MSSYRRKMSIKMTARVINSSAVPDAVRG